MHQIKIAPPGPNARKIVDGFKKSLIDTTFSYPLVIKSGSGCYLEDVDGNVYLDFNSNVCSCAVGYNHPEIIKTIHEHSQLAAPKLAGQDFFIEEHLKLAEKLLSISPKSFSKILITNSGAEAVENSIKLAYRKRGPLPGVSCLNAFHGRTLGALTYTYSKPVQKKNYPQLENKRIKFCTGDLDKDIDQIEHLLKPDHNVAFVMTEIIQGEGGYNIASKNFIRKLRKTTQIYGIPLIVDEVQTGVGRTGKWWAFEHYNIEPDIFCSAKSLQVGATLTVDKYNPKEQGAVSSTWGGGQRIDLAVGLKMLEIIEGRNLMRNATIQGEYLLKRLKELHAKYPDKIKNARGLGLIIAFDVESEATKKAFEEKAFQKGLILMGCGHNSIRITPPLIIEKQQIDEGLEILEQVVREI